MRNSFSLSLLFVVAVVISVAVGFPQAQPGGARRDASRAQTVAISFQGRARHYLLYVPAKPAGSLVLAFHGGGQTAAQMQRITGFDAIADRERFIVAYPEAFERSWADGRNSTSAEQQGIDDVGFAKAVVEDIARVHTIDRSRIFATGLSNGGILTYRLACEAADAFSAIAPVIAAIATGRAQSCRPSVPIAVLGIQGVVDPSVPFDGGNVGGSPRGGKVQGSRATQELWRSLNGCSGNAQSASLPILVHDGTSVDRRSYAGCRRGGEVVWYEIQGGGHRWPPYKEVGGNEEQAQRENGVSSQNINVSEVIWEFFAAHAR